MAYVRDVFGAGIKNVSTTLHWLLLCCLLYPDYYEKILKEIEQVLGNLPIYQRLVYCLLVILLILVSIVITTTGIGTRGLRFDSRADQIGQSVATAVTFCQSATLGYPGAKPRRWVPPLLARFDIVPRVYLMKINNN